MNDPISTLLSLAISHENSASLKERQVAKMKAGKVKRVLNDLNNESLKQRSGIKLDN